MFQRVICAVATMDMTRQSLGMDLVALQGRIRQARERAGTQEEVASQIRMRGGPNLRTLQRWEAGETSPSGVTDLWAFCGATGVSADWLLGLTAPAGDPLDDLPSAAVPPSEKNDEPRHSRRRGGPTM